MPRVQSVKEHFQRQTMTSRDRQAMTSPSVLEIELKTFMNLCDSLHPTSLLMASDAGSHQS
jgi:hypothetical protein